MDLVGRYQLQEQIGEGAMADVWRAYDPGIDRVLAIKLLKPEYRRDAECSARFLREARAAGALSHRNIVTIYDVGEVDGFPYIAMELLDGEPLDQVLKAAGSLDPEAVTAIGLQLADALAYAHGQGVIHRDIKPSNMMLGRDGRSLKILDFGIARVIEAGSVQGNQHLRTQAGQVLGTPRYMSPEQALGREIDGRSDLFSVGVVLYELITGHHAFTGTSAATLALQITQAEPLSIVGIVKNCPRGLQFIIAKLMAKRPEKRFADGAQLAKALQREQIAFAALSAEAASRRYLPLQARLTLLMTTITALVLLASINSVLGRQYAAMERMALTSGSSIATFVANNAALRAVENATLPPAERDWLPVQAFVAAAAADPNVRSMTVVDADGVIRGASDPGLVGSRYSPPSGEPLVERGRNGFVTSSGEGDGAAFRFVHPITYADRAFGTVDVRLSKAGLESAARLSKMLLSGLGVLVLFVVMAVSYAAARGVAGPVGRLKTALRDAARGNLDFRISHSRKDEFGALFDGFNLLTNAVQERLEQAESRPAGRPEAVDATRIGPPPGAGAAPAARRSA